MPGYSLSWLHRERDELRKDRQAFAAALDTLVKRLQDSNETIIPRKPLLHEWSGSRSSVGSLEMALHAIERTLDETERLIMGIENGEFTDLDTGGSN